MRTIALGLVALLVALPASPEDRWEHSGDDANYTNNELEPGVVQPAHDLEAIQGVPDEDWFKIRIREDHSYEARVFASSMVWKYPACQDCATFDRVTWEGNLLTEGDAFTTLGPPGLSVRWIAGPQELEWLRAKVGPGSPGSIYSFYDILLMDTTLFLPRFNNAGGQRTFLILQNIHDRPVSGQIAFRDALGVRLHVEPFSIVAHGQRVLDTSMVGGLIGKSGSAAVAHLGGMAALVGKAVALEPATGFTFDTPLVTVAH